MYIQEIVIDGFKSYATRTVVNGFDASFNAITGLNGSGKSNILDAICFVLGITNLSQVRASNLQDLVYKQGQGGVSKATVSVVFNNDDPRQSPAGYEHCETITVTRTIVIGGRNKYLINGHAVQANTVQDFFHSVQLNVNNPHFLIMQGRITKVLNMKPLEVLGMIEEAAGTRMYEAKKQAAVKTIEKKEAKVTEIGKILADEITPKLNTLREQRLQYLEWAKNNSEAERLARLCVAWEFVCAEAARAAGVEGQRKAIEEGRAATARIGELKALIAGKEGELKAREAARAGSLSGAYKKLMEEEESLGKKAAQSSAALANRRKALKDEENAAAALARARTDAEAAIASLTAQLAKQRAAASEAAAAAAGAADEVSAAIARYNAAAAGMLTEGGAGGGAATTAEGALMAAKARAASLAGDIASGELRLKHLKATARELEKAGRAAAADQAALQAGLARARGALEAKQAKLAGLGFNAAGEEALRARREELSAAVSGGQGDRVEAEWASLAPLVDFSYDAGAMGAGWDRRAVRGTVASLLRVRVPEAATALEVAAGGRLFQVIVDSELVGKALLERGRLRRRVTLIPLNKVSASVIPPHVVRLAAEVSKGRAVPALECVEFDAALRPAIEYALGGMFLCPDAATAKAVCFHPGIGRAVVTYDGDVFDPSGTLEGGSRPDAGSGAGGPLLLRLASVREAMRALEAQRGELKDVEARLAASAKAAAAHATLSGEVELAATEVSLAQARLAGSAGAASEASAEETRGALEREEAALKAAAGSLKEAQGRVRELEGEMANASKAREARTAAAEKALGEAKKGAAAAEGRAKKAAQAVDATVCDLEAAERERATAAGQAAAAEGALATSRGEAASAASLLGDLEERYGKAKAALEGAREELAAADRALKALVKERDAASKGLEEAEGAVKKAEARAKQAAKEAAGGDAAAKELLSKHAWIAGERAFFGKPHTDYDFERSDPKAASARLSALEKQQGELERRINKKVIGMIEAAEREYADLVSKKRIIENDKAKIERVIGELEEKKNEALRTTWAKVNKDFGSIFSTLLPGVTAKLDPPEGGSVLDGLEVKVAFNGVWKETLTDLSGGQRSLLALSLILALLLFKPAPMYILDEVDAALDLSHTQNIGKMIRSHFSKSQFIVVSLKQGMFGNANVIFRTKFVEGIGSTVTRTVPAGSALLADAAGEGAAGAGGSSGRAALGAVGGAGRKKGAGAGAGAAYDDADSEAAYAGAAGAGAGARALKGGAGAGAGGRRRAAGAGAGAAADEEE